MLLNTSQAESSESTRILVYLVGLDIQLKQSEKENPAVKKLVQGLSLTSRLQDII